ncbi:MAG: ABC transporter permease subunit [Firmicutes bacterium]|nr:ABC transporter permease subunit [Bacillota bacterium]
MFNRKKFKMNKWSIILIPYIIYLFLPIVLTLIGSFGEKWYGTLLPEGFTLKWYNELFKDTMFVSAMKNSLVVSFFTVLISILLTVPAVYGIYRLNNKIFKKFLDNIIIIPIAVPPLVMGLGLIQTFNRSFFSLVGSTELLVLAHVIYTLPFMIKPVMANLEMLEWNILNDAADSLGVNSWFKIRRILIPNLAPGIFTGSLITFAMSFGEFQLAVLLTGSANQTYPVVLYQAFYVNTGFASTATVFLIVVTLFSLWSIMFLQKYFNKSSNFRELI